MCLSTQSGFFSLQSLPSRIEEKTHNFLITFEKRCKYVDRTQQSLKQQLIKEGRSLAVMAIQHQAFATFSYKEDAQKMQMQQYFLETVVIRFSLLKVT